MAELMPATVPEFSPHDIDLKLADIGLRRGFITVDEACNALRCSKSHYYAVLAGPPGSGRELRHVKLSDKLAGTYSVDVAGLLLRRERAPIQSRTRGRKKENAA
jgi:hypothetical protein